MTRRTTGRRGERIRAKVKRVTKAMKAKQEFDEAVAKAVSANLDENGKPLKRTEYSRPGVRRMSIYFPLEIWARLVQRSFAEKRDLRSVSPLVVEIVSAWLDERDEQDEKEAKRKRA